MTDWAAIVRADLDQALAQLDADGLEEIAGLLETYRLRVERRLVSSIAPAADDAPADADAIAAALGVPASAIYDWARKGRIPSERYGRFVRFRLSAVRAALHPKTPTSGRRRKPLSQSGSDRPPTTDLPGDNGRERGSTHADTAR